MGKCKLNNSRDDYDSKQEMKITEKTTNKILQDFKGGKYYMGLRGSEMTFHLTRNKEERGTTAIFTS